MPDAKCKKNENEIFPAGCIANDTDDDASAHTGKSKGKRWLYLFQSVKANVWRNH